jgi:ATP adenylyltransferase/5',5'''-P-1,P-4-tetraphosphate phosphorylase II
VAKPLDQIVISDGELAPFVTNHDAASKAAGLLQQQRGVWELLRKGYDSLQSVKTRVFEFDGFQVKVQFNPGRMTSTAAKVDPNSIRERKCFLCTDNLPPAQRGISCDGDYLVLCNPFPIFPEHFTIASLHHTPQVIRDSFPAFLQITRELGARYTVFYNGPRCGASAPDHLHFQAGNRSFLPIDAEFSAAKARSAATLFESDALRVHTLEKCLRHVIAFESADAGVLQRAFEALYAVLQDGAPEGEEPMLNVLGFCTNGEWRVLVFPRAKHRPSFYFKEGDEKLLISPAAVELGGICTTPREQDFEKVTREHIVQLYNEVCVAPEKFASICARLSTKLAALG